MDQIPILQAEGRKAIENWAEASKEGGTNFKQQIDNVFEQTRKLLVI